MSASDLKITFVQSKLHWESVQANLALFSSLLNRIKRGSTDLILLPEMFSTGFTMNASRIAEDMNGSAVQWMKRTASEKKCVVCGSLVIAEKGKYFNRLIWVRDDGSHKYYDKRHLFSLAGEEKVYSAGDKRIVVNVKGWNVLPLICYDLRFPVWSRNQISSPPNSARLTSGFDLLICVANWPAKRDYAWRQLLIARAIENQSYVAGINRIGKDGNGIHHRGYSAVIDPMGKKISKTKPNVISVETVTLSARYLNEVRINLPFLNDADTFSIKI
jgi:predicted amidohydrolase